MLTPGFAVSVQVVVLVTVAERETLPSALVTMDGEAADPVIVGLGGLPFAAAGPAVTRTAAITIAKAAEATPIFRGRPAILASPFPVVAVTLYLCATRPVYGLTKSENVCTL